ncbi:hypothetical protein B0A48_09180 [Cryoendolithus antarcticus]|uniref:Heterokaryon incompatibility domain-containing protein n=1 Tax=Cryoendolithus antarcticus TaxID=1507870 RepID=A0A1V8T2N0_9PEZI|nr:hypothetical protein B0A48_09180 [Cryoendolithus antarcticus]
MVDDEDQLRRLAIGEFRILTIHPGSPQAAVKCSARIYRSFTRCPSYEALSYAWGDGKDHGIVYVSVDKERGDDPVSKEDLHKVALADQMRVYRYIYDNLTSDGTFSGCTRNCENALRRFRLQDKPRTLWVDAICINQKDKVERSRQVQIMGHIYHYADRVIVYSGQAENPKWTNLLSPSYFQRLWPVQELLHAQKIRLYYGNSSIDWDVLSSDYEAWKRDVGPMDRCSTAPTAVGPSDFFELRRWYLRQPARRVRLTVEDQREHERLSSVGRLDKSQLVTILRMTLALSCKEPLDEFYAVHSLFYGELYSNIWPDYGKSLRDLHEELVKIVGLGNKEELRDLLNLRLRLRLAR